MATPVEQILAMVNKANATVPGYVVLTPDDVSIVAMANGTSSIKRTTKAIIDAQANRGFKGEVFVYYDWLDLSVLFKNIIPAVDITVTEGMTTEALLPLLNARYGTSFSAVDFETKPLTVSSAVQLIQLDATTSSLLYTGSFSVEYGVLPKSLNRVVQNTVLNGLTYGSSDLTKGQAGLYSYNFDASSDVSGFWDDLTVAVVPDEIIQHFGSIDGLTDSWVLMNDTTSYNLSGSQVVFNGTTAAAIAAGYTANSAFNHVAVIQLGSRCSNFAGNLTVHYGGKVATSAPEAPTEVVAG